MVVALLETAQAEVAVEVAVVAEPTQTQMLNLWIAVVRDPARISMATWLHRALASTSTKLTTFLVHRVPTVKLLTLLAMPAIASFITC